MGGRASPTTRGGGSGRAPRGQGTFADPDRSRDGTIPARAHLRSAGKKGATTKENIWCLRIISGVMLLLALGLAVVAAVSAKNGTGGGIWIVVIAISVGVMVLSGLFGMIASTQYCMKIPCVEDHLVQKYVVMLALAFMIMLWLSMYVLFNFEDVKILMKEHVFVHWSEVWASLAEDDQEQLQTYHRCTARGPPDAECWDALQEELFVSWKYGGFIVFATVVLLPFNIFLIAQRVGWDRTADEIQSAMAVLMLGVGIGCFVLAYSLASGFVVPAVLTGLIVTLLALIQLIPNIGKRFCLSQMERFEEKAGKVLFVVFSLLAAANLVFSLWCITAPTDVRHAQ